MLSGLFVFGKRRSYKQGFKRRGGRSCTKQQAPTPQRDHNKFQKRRKTTGESIPTRKNIGFSDHKEGRKSAELYTERENYRRG